MMRLESGGTATAASKTSQQTSAMAMSTNSLTASTSSDFMGNNLASYFSQLFEKNPQDPQSQGKEKRAKKKSKKSKAKEKRKIEPLTDLYPSLPQVSIPKNPSPFAVFAAIRNTCLENKRKQDTILQLQSAAAWKEVEDNSNLGTEDLSSSDEAGKNGANLPKIVAIGLQGVFEIIRESQNQFPSICKRALESLSDILGGLSPEELSSEPSNIIDPMFDSLLELATQESNDCDEIRSLASACLLSLSIGYGDTGKTLLASSSMLMSQPHGPDNIKMPPILVSLQRSVISVMLGKLDHPNFMSHGLLANSLLDNFEVNFKGTKPNSVHSLTSDGSFIYLQTSEGLFKVGSGYGGTVKGQIYAVNKEFYGKNGWIGYANQSLFFKAANSNLDFNCVSKDDLNTEKVLVSSNETTLTKPGVMFSDGNNIGVVLVDANDKFVVRFLSTANCSTIESELTLKLARKSIDVFGSSTIEEGKMKHQVEFGFEDEMTALQAGKEFAILLTNQGRVYFTGKSTALGQKQPCPNGQWNEMAITKGPKIIQLAVGHDGLHCLLLSEDGCVYFVGTARRGEDGDQTKARRPPKPVKPKLFSRLEGQNISYVAANSGTSAIVSKSGDLFLFGKDSTQCDWSGQVIELKGQHIVQVALGKAHIVALNRDGDVFTFGMNNKGQCGREFQAPTIKEPQIQPQPSSSQPIPVIPTSTSNMMMATNAFDVPDDVNSDHDIDTEQESSLSEVMCPSGKHKWKHDQCMVCAICGECTGYGSHCVSSGRPDRNPGMLCGCGSGDSGCAECGCCRSCAGEDGDIGGASAALASERARLRDRLIRMEYLAGESNLSPEDKKFIRRRGYCRRSRRYTEKREGRRESELLKALESSMNKERNAAVAAAAAAYASSGSNLAQNPGNPAASSDIEKDSSGKLASLPPSKLNFGHKVTQIATGLQHTLLLTLEGQVYSFGSNNYGQLGLQDLNPRGSPTKIGLNFKAISISCGGYHSVILLENGQVLTFGSYQKGQLGREAPPDSDENSGAISRDEIARRKLWFAFPECIAEVGFEYGRSATWIGASGDQTFIRVDETLINAKSLINSTIMANKNHILILPTQEANFKSLAISRSDGFCRSFTGPEQASFQNQIVNLDPLYNVVWSYDNKSGTLSSYQSTFDSNQRESILTPELALPLASNHLVSRNQASLNMLSCLDTLTHFPDVTLTSNDEETNKNVSAKSFSKEDFTAVNRFDNHGGGWGYSGHSIEAIRFMVDTDILLGGFGLFGGRGEYVGKIKLFDIGTEGGDQEGDGDLLAESDEIAYECGARQKYPILFDEAVTIHAGRWYVAWARVSGPSSDCGSSGQAQVTTDDQIQFYFKSSKKSNNGTDVNAGQIPQLLYKLVSNEGIGNHRRAFDPQEPVSILSKNFSRKVTPDCFHALLSLIKWSWNAFKAGLCELMRECQDNAVICDLQRLIYVCRACLRLTVTYTEVVYPARIAPNQSKPMAETQKLAECIYDCRSLLQQILTDGLTVLHNSKANYGQHKTGLGLTKMIMQDAHRSFVACFHAFYPTGYLKWACLCNLLASMESSSTNLNYDRLLTAVLDALCNPMIKLRNTFPITYSPETETRNTKLSPTSTSMIQADQSSFHQFPILSELMNFRSHLDGIRFASWTFREVLDRLLAIAAAPVKSVTKNEHNYSKELVEKSCLVISSVISELANQTVNGENDLQCLGGRILHCTPNRFTRTSNNRTWNTGNGSPDAICFSVDRAGIFIVGCCVYGGMGTYEYELELLDDQSSNTASDKNDHTSSQQRWTSQEIAHGSYSADDCTSDIAELKFERAVAIKPHVKYALRLRNHGGRTSNGDGGVSTVKGPDGTTFSFTSCSLSFNGTNPTRGQLPQMLYFSSPQENDVQAATKSLAETYARRTALSMTSAIVKVVTGLLINARDCLEDEKSFELLNRAPIITKLMPHILASISSLASSDPHSAVQVLSFIQEILPSVASLQNLYLLNQENDGLTSASETEEENAEAKNNEIEAASQHYAWVESEHPYKPASVNTYRVLFPASVHWMSVEFDSQCSTTQPEDVLQLYIRNRNEQMHHGETIETGSNANNSTSTVLNNSELTQKYTPVLKKFSGTGNWPKQNVILPGNEVLFSLETASDYVKDDKTNNFGFKCLVVGYEGFSNKDDGLRSLEMELAYLGGLCAASLMRKDIPLSNQDIPEVVQQQRMGGANEDMDIIEDSASEAFEMHSSLLSKGFALERPPNVQQALDGIIPFSFNSNERLFLRHFVTCTSGTSGGRLARWLQPESFVDVDQCEVLFRSQDDLKCNWPTIITIVTRDQYGDCVQVPELKVEVSAVPIEEINQSVTRLRKMAAPDAMTFGGHRPPSLEPKYEVTVMDKKMLYHAITVQPAYENYSFEELRYASPALQRQSETMLVRPNNDGTYSANWTPGNIGFYQIHVSIDGCEMPEPYKVEVRDPPQGVPPPHQREPSSKKSHGDHINRLRKFIAKPSAGLRIRIHPTLQSEQIGVVPVEGTINIVDEFHNSDGVWVRLGQESLLEFANVPNYSEGWCLQFNQHLEKTLLVPVAAEPKQGLQKTLERTQPPSSVNTSSSGSNPFFTNTEPILKPTIQEKPEWKAIKKPKGPGLYTVVKCGASGHNVRSSPSLMAPPIGMLALADQVNVLRTKEVAGEVWVQLEVEAAAKHCFAADEGDAWALAYSNTDILYLEAVEKRPEQDPLARGRSMSRPITVIPPPSSQIPNQKPVPPPRLMEPAQSSRSLGRTRTPSPKPSFFQKWFKGEAIKRAGSQSPTRPKVASASANKDIPPELIGVSVKELVKVIGESRANGNGVTPPGTPGTPRKSRSPASVSSRGSSPSSVRLTGQPQPPARPSKSPSHESSPPQPPPRSESPEKVQKRKSPRIRVDKGEKRPVKEALSPSVAESIRAVFAAFVWHEGIVHDTMAVASYLKFHPNLSKHGHGEMAGGSLQGGKSEESPSRQRQRHSVEVSLSAYMNANNLENFKVSSSCGATASSASSSLHQNANIREIPEEIQPIQAEFPPTIKLLVYLWDEIKSYCIQAILQHMIVASPNNSVAPGSGNSASNVKSYSSSSSKKDKGGKTRKRKSRDEIYVDPKEADAASTAAKVLEEAFHQLCEMCGHYFQHPVTYHMRSAHPGCGGHAGSKGYNSGGHYCGGWAGNCGDGGVGGSSWYLICEKCRALHMSRSRQIDIESKNRANLKSLHRKKASFSNPNASASTQAQSLNSHIIMTNNAMFLLDLASSSNINSQAQNSKMKLNSVSELESMDPNPFPLVPFQCFNKLGVRDSHLRLINDELVLDEVLKSNDSNKDEITPPEQFQNNSEVAKRPFSRSASVGNQVLKPENSQRQRTNSSSDLEADDFLSKPSKALQKLFGSSGEGPNNVIDILQRPVMSFILQWNDLESLQISMTQALRKAACRSFALQALNWLLRSVSQPACLHDLLWCFVSALETNTLESGNLNDPEKNQGQNKGLFDHPTEDISIAGEAIQPLPAIFHGLLQTVSDLMLLLPVGSSLQQIAITCWCIKFRPQDHNFLHQSHVFSTISKILSRSEEYSDSASNLEDSDSTLVESIMDLTCNLELKVSSRVAMVGSLNDNSTETFWESSDEDRNKSKWISASISNPKNKVKSISVHIDNGRDIGNKVSHLTFKGQKSNAENSEFCTIKTVDVESRFAGWVNCFVDDHLSSLKIEAKGPDNTLRMRQIKALGYVENPLMQKQPRASSIQQKNCETETLRVFRLITSQVFGRLLDTSKEESVENDLKEHVVGILFSRSKLTHLQKQVCSHIVTAIKKESLRLKEDWEVNLCSSEPILGSTDTYCFEMMSLVLALSGSTVGRSHLATQYNFIKDLLSLLHTASGRIQRQVIALLRRILPEVRPETLAGLLGITVLPPKDFASLARSETNTTQSGSIGILDVFLSCIAKALTLQVKSKLNKTEQASKTHLMTVNLASSIHPRDPTGPRWWLRGTMTKKISEEIIHLLKDMTCGNISSDWADITKSAVAEAILNLTRIEEGHRDPSECLKNPVLWLSLASLCVLDKDHVDGLSSGDWNGSAEASSRPTCDNHDDNETLAIILCDSCGNLCADCDRFLHLHRKTKNHQRQIFKEEEDSIKVDLHEGCGRTKLFWLMALADSLTLKAMVEFRDGSSRCNKNFTPENSKSSTKINFSTCRFCLRQSSPDYPVMDSLCSDKECLENSKLACTKVLNCGHYCGGILDETTCLPCLHGCSGSNSGLRQDADDMCMICFTEALCPIPSIQLACGHVFHYTCCRKILQNKWTGPRITFGFRNCPICKTQIQHESLKNFLDPIQDLYEDVKKKALMRLEYEGLTKSEAVIAKGARFFQDPTGFALDRYAYYVCFKCGKAYFGGEAQCDEAIGDDYNPEELVCGGCSDVSRAQMCPKHGTDYLEYKCRYCCSVAVFFCFGTTHFCNACHDDFQRVANVPKHELPQCPVGPRSVQLEGEECPLHVAHPPTGEEYALGCGVCRNAHTF